MGMLRTVPNPGNPNKTVEVYSRVQNVGFTDQRAEVDGVPTMIKFAAVVVASYESEEAYRAGFPQVANPFQLQLNSRDEMFIKSPIKDPETQRLINPGVKGPRLDAFFQAAGKAAQPGDTPDVMIWRAIYALLATHPDFKSAEPVLEPGQTLVPVEFAHA